MGSADVMYYMIVVAISLLHEASTSLFSSLCNKTIIFRPSIACDPRTSLSWFGRATSLSFLVPDSYEPSASPRKKFIIIVLRPPAFHGNSAEIR